MGAKEGIDDQMGRALDQVDAAHLRIGGRPMLAAGSTKGQGIGQAVRHVLDRTVDGHQSQAEDERRPASGW